MKIKKAGAQFFIAIFLLTIYQEPVFARHKMKKFKGVIIVNQILKLDGTMTVNGAPAPEYSGIKEGDLLETNPKSFAIIRIPGLGIFRLGASTKLRLRKFANRDETRFDLVTGELLSLIKRSGSHELKLPHSEIKLQETALEAKVTATDEAVSLYHGKIQIEDLFEGAEEKKNEVLPPPPNGVALDQVLPIKGNSGASLSRAEIKAPAQGPVPVQARPPAMAKNENSSDSSSRELTVATTQGTGKLIRVTPSGLIVADQLSLLPQEKNTLSDLESLYSLP